jgi:hypothetical protein
MKINNLASLRRETERLEYKLKVDKGKLKSDIKLLRFYIFEYIFKEVLGLFRKSPAKEEKSAAKEDTSGKNKSAENNNRK